MKNMDFMFMKTVLFSIWNVFSGLCEEMESVWLQTNPVWVHLHEWHYQGGPRSLSDQQMWTLPNVWTCRLQGVPAFCHVSGRSTCELCLSACRIVPRVWRSVSTFSLLMIIWSFVEMFHTKRLESSVTVAPTLQELNDYMDICKCRKVSGCTA